ncbi:ankyrin repeat domain-containing protein 40-like [Mytilus galloprovincialis]|uniref:ankyrin repeat domain-containing protein 40-like n=1 Tax=Mytilus galloprovincialis TaxID=29158 RepID=UPI003F7C3565
MSATSENDESFREAACNGDKDSLKKLLETFSIDVNSQNPVNGWSALHWGCKRNHKGVVEFLLQKGANKDLLTAKGEKPVDLTTSEDLFNLLGGSGNRIAILKKDESSFTPNYLANPVFPYTQPVADLESTNLNEVESVHSQQKSIEVKTTAPTIQTHQKSIEVKTMQGLNENELVLKIRVAYLDDRDFIEVEMEKSNLTYESLKSVMCKELGVERRLINKIRKLPNTILRKDKDVQRLCDFQELEVVLTNKVPPASAGMRGLAAPIKNQEVLY